MTTVTDDFNRADGGLGANWTTIEGSFGVLTNRCEGTGGVNSARYSAYSPGTDQFAQCTILATVDTVSDSGAGPGIRFTSGGDLLFLQCNTSESRVYKRISGSYTQIGSDGPAFAAGDIAYIEISGSNVTAKKNGTSIITGTTTTPASGQGGIWAAPSSGALHVDDWSGGDLVAAGGSIKKWFPQMQGGMRNLSGGMQ